MLNENRTGKFRHKIITRRCWLFGTETFLVLQEEISYLDSTSSGGYIDITDETCWRNVTSLDCEVINAK